MWKLFPSQVSLCLCVSLHPVSLPTPSPFFQLPPLLRTLLPSHSFLLFLWTQDIGHFRWRPWARQFLVNDAPWPSDCSLSITTRARTCTHPLHDFFSLTHTHSQKDDTDHAPGLFQMPRFIFGAHLCHWLGTECVFHRRRVPKLFRGSRRGVASPGHWPCVQVLSTFCPQGSSSPDIC